MNKMLYTYENGDTIVTIYEDGTKVRVGDGYSKYPESMDVKITDYCDAACSWCHENSTTKGKHGDLQHIIDIYSKMPAGVEIAIGGGNPLSHPDFDDFVVTLSENGTICNVTINEKHWDAVTKSRINALVSRNALKGVGYSYSEKPLQWDYEHACTHLIVGLTPFTELSSVVKQNVGKVLLLGYKDYRRGNNYLSKHKEFITNNIKGWYRHLFTCATEAHLSFDNLAIEQLNPKRLFVNDSSWDQFFLGEDGTRTMYIDAVKQKYTKNSTCPIVYGIPEDCDIASMFDTVKNIGKTFDVMSVR